MSSKMDSASIVPGLYSEAARKTEFEISHLRSRCQLDDELEVQAPAASRGGGHSVQKPKLSRTDESSSRLSKTAGQLRVEAAVKTTASKALQDERTNQPDKAPIANSELARAISEKLNQKLAASGKLASMGIGAGFHENRANFSSDVTSNSHSPVRKTMRPTRCFATPEFYDGPWASKFTAQSSPGALNRWNEQRPDPLWYKLQYDAVLDRQPEADFSEHPKHVPRPRSRSHAHDPAASANKGDTFALTGVDGEEDSPRDARAEKAAERAKWREQLANGPAPPFVGYFAKTPNWDEYGKMKVGRYLDVHYNRVSYPAKDLNQQDIKGYPKIRYPEWNMEHTMGHQPLQKADNLMPPGKYDVNFSAVSGKILSGVAFDRALMHSQSDGQLGHFAKEAILHTDESRFPGGVTQDRSRGKDIVRHRITNVNDFQRELPRPNLPPASAEYHDKEDAVACEITLQHQLSFDADAADLYVTSRRDIAPGYGRMLSRGKEAVQGIRALQSDLGVRGAVGLGFTETTGQATKSVQKLEGRTVNAEYQKPDVGPVFEHHTQYQPLCMKNNYNHGHPPVVGAGPRYEAKHAPLQKARVEASFKRQAASKGFTRQAVLGGTKVARQSRVHEALGDWSNHLTSRVQA